jgi:hypothetical protein
MPVPENDWGPVDWTFQAERAFSPLTGERTTGPDVARYWTHVRNLAHPHPVTRLKALVDIRAELDAEIDAAVVAARAMRPKRATWKEIGKAVGLSKQGAQNRWGPKGKRP